ncbi:hypothetical protein BH10BAC2_BH10BAC2_13540 [soil metagenome]
MKISFEIYLKALGFYAVLTTPALVEVSIYFLSLFGALIFGFFAWIVFLLVLRILQCLPFSKKTRWLILVFSIPLGVAADYTLIGLFIFNRNVWVFHELLLFLLAAVIAGWISLYTNRSIVTTEFLNRDGLSTTSEEAANFIE